MTELQELKRLALAATPGPWKWWTSNSHIRLSGASGKDGDVICAISPYSGTYPQLLVSAPNREYIAAINPQAVLELIERLEKYEYIVKNFSA